MAENDTALAPRGGPVAGELVEVGDGAWLDPDFSKAESLIWAPWDIGTPAGKAMVMRCGGRATRATQPNLNVPFDLWAVFGQLVQVRDKQSGQMVPAVRTVLVLHGGDTMAFVSKGMASAVRLLVKCYGPGPYDPPIKVVVRSIPLREVGNTYGIDVIDDGIEALFNPAAKRKGK